MEAKEYRYILHQIPELGRKEYKTCEYILSVAKKYDCEILRPTETSVVLYFNANKIKTICLRADMDGLPILEESNNKYKSKHNGIMHACGHDGHMAMLLSTCDWINENKDKLVNNVIALFQPSEEDNAGAKDILNSNILDKLNTEYIFGMHIWPNLEENKLYSMPLGMLATSAEVNITIVGKSAHAANRDLANDAMLAGINLINSFYDEMSKFKEPHLINFGKIESGTARNVVAGLCKIEATMRCYLDADFDYMVNSLKILCKKIEMKYKVSIELWINPAYPSVINDISLYQIFKDELDINELDTPFLQAEDFGCYTRKYKSLFLLLGCGNKHLLHTSTFDFNADILETGVEAYKKIIQYKF